MQFAILLIALVLSAPAAASAAGELTDSACSSGDSEDPSATSDSSGYEVSERIRKQEMDKVKANFLKLFGLKQEPRKPHNKAYVPYDILIEYAKNRELSRAAIPDDRAYFGKIDMNDLDTSHENYWTLNVKNHSALYEVDLGADDELTRRQHIIGNAERISYTGPNEDPQDVPHRMQHILPPFSRNKRSPRQFVSVLMKFNVSSQIELEPITSEELRGAELHLSREKVVEDDANNEKLPRYQRIYVLQIFDYDDHNEPITRIHDSKRIDTHHDTPLVFDIHSIVKHWLRLPERNFGIIVRIANDDKDEAHANVNIQEHVRLKRAFHSSSESDEVWLRKRPSILIYSNPPESKRLKRDHSHGGRQANRSQQSKSKPYKMSRRCSKRNMTINFDEIGWTNWIIAPQSFIANYCHGDCTYPDTLDDSLESTNHGKIQSIYHAAGRNVGRPGCAPTKLSPLAILYQVDGIVQMKHYDDMTVDSCGCL